jgi:hypothetical protein
MLIQTIASYTERNTNSKRILQHAMLINTNGMMIVRRLRKIRAIRGKDRRGRTPLWIKIFMGKKREAFMPL